MIESIISHVTNFITHVISSWGYGGVGALMAVQSAAIPLPSEIILPFAGFLTGSGRFSLIGLAIAGGTGSTIGSLVAYTFGARYGKFIPLPARDLELAQKFFNKFGPPAIFIGQLLPVIRSFIAIPAGVAKIRMPLLIIYTFIGSFIWSYFLAWVGLRLGENWLLLDKYFRQFDAAVVVVIVIVLFYWVRRHWKRS